MSAPSMSAPSMSAPVVEMVGVHAGYDGIAVVRDLDLVVNPGEVVALLGPNGAGKTTSLLTISGLLRPISGWVAVMGQNTDGMAPHKIAQLGLAHVAEDRSLFFDLTVQENIRLGIAGNRAARASSYDRAMELFPALRPLGGRPAGLLSGGEQQMLAMARAVMLNPDVVLLDEPSMGLAPILVEEVFRIISRLKGEGVTMLLVEQFAAAALGVADYGYVLENGRIAVHGPAAQLKDDPAVKAAYLGGSH